MVRAPHLLGCLHCPCASLARASLKECAAAYKRFCARRWGAMCYFIGVIGYNLASIVSVIYDCEDVNLDLYVSVITQSWAKLMQPSCICPMSFAEYSLQQASVTQAASWLDLLPKCKPLRPAPERWLACSCRTGSWTTTTLVSAPVHCLCILQLLDGAEQS